VNPHKQLGLSGLKAEKKKAYTKLRLFTAVGTKLDRCLGGTDDWNDDNDNDVFGFECDVGQ